MQSLSDDERKAILGEVLLDELKIIHEYLRDMPIMKEDIRHIRNRVDNIDSRLIVVEAVAKDHEADLQQIKHHLAIA